MSQSEVVSASRAGRSAPQEKGAPDEARSPEPAAAAVETAAAGRARLAVGDRLLRALRRPWVKAVLGAQLVALAVVLARSEGWLQPLELLVYDTLRVAWATDTPRPRILLVGVTESDIARLRDRWPLHDGDLADLLERLESWKPRVIGVDIYRDFPRPPGSERLDAVLAHYKNILWIFKLRQGKHPQIPPPKPLIGTDQAVLADIVTDPGRIARRGLLFADDGKNEYTAMGMGLALGYLAPDKIMLQAGPTPDSLRLGKAVIYPLDNQRGPYVRMDARGYQTLMDYRHGPSPFRMEDYARIMQSDAAAPLVRGRAVLVGGAAESVEDYFGTPFNTGFNTHSPVWGFDVHAHIANQLIREALHGGSDLVGLSRPFEDLWIWAWAMAGAGLGLLVSSTLLTVGGGFAGIGAVAGIVYAAFGMNLLLPALPAAGAWLGAAALTNQLLHAASNRARARLRRSFEHYLPPAVISKMLEADELPKLGGERRELSVVFSDIASSTTLAETIDPAELAPLMNAYFEGVGAAIFAEGGYINEFMGDGVLSFFGAPQDQPDHADRAVAAALGIAAFGDRFSAEQHARGVAFGHTRVGVHCGIAMVGNVGTQSRLKYSALGDVLNTGSRLEGLNKAIGTRVCVSDAIVKRCRRSRFRPIGDFVVKGRREPTPIFEPVDAARYTPEHLARYEAAYAALAARRSEASRLFAELYEEAAADPCVAFHHRRIEAGESGTLIVMAEK